MLPDLFVWTRDILNTHVRIAAAVSCSGTCRLTRSLNRTSSCGRTLHHEKPASTVEFPSNEMMGLSTYRHSILYAYTYSNIWRVLLLNYFQFRIPLAILYIDFFRSMFQMPIVQQLTYTGLHGEPDISHSQY